MYKIQMLTNMAKASSATKWNFLRAIATAGLKFKARGVFLTTAGFKGGKIKKAIADFEEAFKKFKEAGIVYEFFVVKQINP